MENNNTQKLSTPSSNDSKVKILIGVVIAGVALCICLIVALLFLLNQNKPKQMSCTYEGKSYSVGEGFMDKDGCNSCACSENGEVACTLKFCAPIEEPASSPVGYYQQSAINDLVLDNFAECDISVGLPPQSGLYVESMDTVEYKWSTQKATPLSNPEMSSSIMNKGAIIVGQWPYFLDSGNIAGSDNNERTVGIYCGENKNYTIESFIEALKGEFNATAMEVWGQEFTIENLGMENKWGEVAYKIKVDGPFESAEEDYIVFKGNTVYRLTKNMYSNGGFVNLTVDAVYNSIVFN